MVRGDKRRRSRRTIARVRTARLDATDDIIMTRPSAARIIGRFLFGILRRRPLRKIAVHPEHTRNGGEGETYGGGGIINTRAPPLTTVDVTEQRRNNRRERYASHGRAIFAVRRRYYAYAIVDAPTVTFRRDLIIIRQYRLVRQYRRRRV